MAGTSKRNSLLLAHVGYWSSPGLIVPAQELVVHYPRDECFRCPGLERIAQIDTKDPLVRQLFRTQALANVR